MYRNSHQIQDERMTHLGSNHKKNKRHFLPPVSLVNSALYPRAKFLLTTIPLIKYIMRAK